MTTNYSQNYSVIWIDAFSDTDSGGTEIPFLAITTTITGFTTTRFPDASGTHSRQTHWPACDPYFHVLSTILRVLCVPHLYKTPSAYKALPVQFGLEGTRWQRSEGKQSPKVKNETLGDTVLSIPQQAHESPALQFWAETVWHLLRQMAAEMLA